MTTTIADETRDDAVLHLNRALLCLSKIVVERADGWDEYSPKYQDDLADALSKTVAIRQLVEGHA